MKKIFSFLIILALLFGCENWNKYGEQKDYMLNTDNKLINNFHDYIMVENIQIKNAIDLYEIVSEGVESRYNDYNYEYFQYLLNATEQAREKEFINKKMMYFLSQLLLYKEKKYIISKEKFAELSLNAYKNMQKSGKDDESLNQILDICDKRNISLEEYILTYNLDMYDIELRDSFLEQYYVDNIYQGKRRSYESENYMIMIRESYRKWLDSMVEIGFDEGKLLKELDIKEIIE